MAYTTPNRNSQCIYDLHMIAIANEECSIMLLSTFLKKNQLFYPPHLHNISSITIEKCKNYALEQKTAVILQCILRKGYEMKCIQWFWVFVMEVGSYGGERVFCFRVSKLAFLFQQHVHLFIYRILAQTITHLCRIIHDSIFSYKTPVMEESIFLA